MLPNGVQVEIRGRVQGVGYRAWLAQVAGMFGVRGWVRNRHDGWVEAVLIAEEADRLEPVLAMIHRGPEAARVEDVATRPLDEDETAGIAAGFEVRPDA